MASPALSASLGLRRPRPSVSINASSNAEFEHTEPTSPKVTCIGQVRVKSTRKKSKNKKKRKEKVGLARSRSMRETNQRWVHLHLGGLCEAVKEISCFYSCGSSMVEKEEGEEEAEEETHHVCIPPPNALLLMRCRSDPVKMAALESRFWASPAAKIEDGSSSEVEEQQPEPKEEEKRRHSFEERSLRTREVEGKRRHSFSNNVLALEEEREERSKEKLPDCLLLMMYEPKLSMEVSRETWVCSEDFAEHRARCRKVEKERPICRGVESEKAAEAEEKVFAAPSTAPPEAAKTGACRGKLALMRCNSEPVRTSARVVPELCFRTDRHRPVDGVS